MDMNALRQFVAIVDAGGFRPAARRLGVTPSALSHAMRRLEEQTRVRLLNRNSRSVHPTDAGRALLERVGPALREIEDAASAIATASATGTARLNVPRLASQTLLAKELPAFHAANPGIRIEVTVDNRAIDIVAEGYDAGIRLGRVLQPDVIAVPVGPLHDFSAVAAPAYLDRRGLVCDPAELADHDCIGYRFADGRIFPWQFRRGAQEETFIPTDRMILSDPLLTCTAAIAGMGIAYTVTAFLEDAIEDGRLVRVLKDWETPAERLHIYYSGRRHVPIAVRKLIDWFKRTSPSG